MKPMKQFVSPLLLLLAFVGLLIFISTSFEMSTTAAGKVTAVSIGFGTPWYQQVLRPSGFSRELNLLAPSFLAGIAGLFIILNHLVQEFYKNRGKAHYINFALF